MTPKIDVITIAVADLARAREFYERGFSCPVQAEPNATLSLSLGANASRLALRPWDTVAFEAGVDAHSTGFRGFTLSYILESADAVDALLARVQGHGGTVSKPPRNALWGYSAYVSDPDGHLWKIASSKRRPLIARTPPPEVNGRPIEAQEVPITIGVADIKPAKDFYKDAIGFPVKKDYRRFVMFSGPHGTSDLGLYKREALAADAAVAAEGSGFRGFTITHAVDSPERVDALLAGAAQAGATTLKARHPAGEDGYSRYFADPDGVLWKIVSPS